MNKDTEEKVMMLLRTLAEEKNWKLSRVYGMTLYTWEKEHYDPMYVAQELLDLINA